MSYIINGRHFAAHQPDLAVAFAKRQKMPVSLRDFDASKISNIENRRPVSHIRWSEQNDTIYPDINTLISAVKHRALICLQIQPSVVDGGDK